MTIKEIYKRTLRAVNGSSKDHRNDASMAISESGSMSVDRDALHSSERFRRQIEALQKIDSKLRKA